MQKNDKQVFIWLLSGCALIALMLIIGGVTRLTNSGLSMVDWKVVGGIIPPLTEVEWQKKFELYQQFPEYKIKHAYFTLSDFKGIFFWEYLHRLTGRFIGIVFLFPFLYFLITKKFRQGFTKKVLSLFFLGGLQGLAGWYMVKSGLIDRPDVSHYRLALHLLLAMLTYGLTLWFALSLFFSRQQTADSRQQTADDRLQNLILIFLIILSLQIFYGALVAGLDAGLVYNTFPKMRNNFFPAQLNFHIFSDAVTVQFIHRYLAKFLFLFGLYIVYSGSRQQAAGSRTKNKLLLIFTACLLFQFLLGILTLLYAVPVVLGVLHQFGALLLLSITIVLLSFLAN